MQVDDRIFVCIPLREHLARPLDQSLAHAGNANGRDAFHSEEKETLSFQEMQYFESMSINLTAHR